MRNEIRKHVAIGIIEAAARLICDRIRVEGIDVSMLDSQSRMTIACLAEQLRRIAPEASHV